jgi:hypothetical protein
MREVWDLWFPDAGSTGTSFARSRVDDQAAGGRLLVHAAPPKLEVTVRDQDSKLIAQGSESRTARVTWAVRLPPGTPRPG